VDEHGQCLGSRIFEKKIAGQDLERRLFSAGCKPDDLIHLGVGQSPTVLQIAPGTNAGEYNIDISDEDARRLVACVNACAGIPTEVLEAGKLAEWLKENKT
jgi:hypothetical protein